MARGKDAPVITGGQIDPYVASTIQQGKQQKENRILAAMRESGATTRTAMQEQGATARAASQNQARLQAQAAQTAADDRRAAEAERGRREDMKFTQAMQESNQVFTAKQAELKKEHDLAMIKGEREYAEKIRTKQEALRRFEIEKQTAAQERSTNAILSVLKGGLQRESTKEKAMTVLNQEADKFDKDKKIYERTKTRVVDSVKNDKRLDLPVADVIKEQWEARKKKGTWAVVTRGIPGAITAATDIYKSYREIKGYEGVADPMGVLQDQLDKNEAKVGVEHLAPDKIHKIEDAMQNGTLSAEDIRTTLGVLEGMADVLKQKRIDNPLKTNEAAYDFWNNSYQTVIDMRNAVEGLAKSQKKIEGREKETVGSRVQYALGVIRNNSLGGRAARLRELTGGNYEAVFDEMTKAIEVPSLWPIDPEMSPYEKEIRREDNAMLQRVYPTDPNLGGIE